MPGHRRQFLMEGPSRRVLFIDGEMPGAPCRLAALPVVGADPSRARRLYFLLADIQGTLVLPDLGSEEGRRSWSSSGAAPDLLIVDNLSSLVSSTETTMSRAGRSYKRSSFGCVHGYRRSCGPPCRKEANSGHQPEGDVLDTSIALRRPPDYARAPD